MGSVDFQPPGQQEMERSNLPGEDSLAPTCPLVYAIADSFSPSNGKLPPGKGAEFSSPDDAEAKPKKNPKYIAATISSLNITVDCYISTAFITIQGTYLLNNVPVGGTCDCVLAVPMSYQGIVTSVDVDMGGGKMYVTAVVPREEAAAMSSTKTKGAGVALGSFYNPNLFKLGIPQVEAGSKLQIQVMYFQPMTFRAGMYEVSVPLTLPMEARPEGLPLASLCSIACSLNSGRQVPVNIGKFRHPMKVASVAPGQASFVTDANASAASWPNADFIASYQVWGEGILPGLIVQGPPLGAQDKRSTFCVSISPPDPARVQAFQRAVVFVVDRSASMKGRPMEAARHALLLGLRELRPSDLFFIIAFDDGQLSFSDQMEAGEPEMVARACKWVLRYCEARGFTNILAALQLALEALRGVKDAVPYIFLMTDGAVKNERQVARFMADVTAKGGLSAPRISTLGIGRFCNHYFLKWLAVIGRGIAEMALTADDVRGQMERLLLAASTPLLSNITLGSEYLPPGTEVYPSPVPDLFCGHPLLVSGKYVGEFPESLDITGLLPDGKQWQATLRPSAAPHIPLSKVFVKQQLDLMTAVAWLKEDRMMEKQVVALSIATGVTSEYTTMVGFSTTSDQHRQLLQDRAEGKTVQVKKYANTKTVAVAVVAGFVIGFGSLAATDANEAVADAVNSAVDDLGSMLGDVANELGNCADCCG